MGQCRWCTWFNEKYFSWDSKRKEDITLRNYCSYLRQQVSPSASCNNYSEAPTSNNSGYTGGSGGGCFLTSACVEYLGKSDGCEELTALRAFRDNYMKKTDEGIRLVEEYYSIAPAIVEKINASPKRAEYYNYINGVVNECITLIKKDKNEQTLEKYKQMVLCLKKEFEL